MTELLDDPQTLVMSLCRSAMRLGSGKLGYAAAIAVMAAASLGYHAGVSVEMMIVSLREGYDKAERDARAFQSHVSGSRSS